MARVARILIAEDEGADVGLIQIVLQGEGIGAEAAAVACDGAEALDYLHCRGQYDGRSPGNPELILLDLKLPKISGLEVLKQIRAEEDLRAVPVVIFSSSLDERDRKESLACGADDFVVKPINFEAFEELIIRIVNTYIHKP
jgi:CheY-like chemotaxis protein